MWGLGRDLLRPSPRRAPFQPPPRVAEERGGFRGGGHLSPPRIALDKCHVGLKAGFTPAVSQAGPFPTAPARGRGEGRVPRRGTSVPPAHSHTSIPSEAQTLIQTRRLPCVPLPTVSAPVPP